MSESALYVKSSISSDGKYYAVGISTPSFRVFATSDEDAVSSANLTSAASRNKNENGLGNNQGINGHMVAYGDLYEQTEIRTRQKLTSNTAIYTQDQTHGNENNNDIITMSIHDRARVLAATRDVTLTSLLVEKLELSNQHNINEITYEKHYICFAGFSNGLVMAVDIKNSTGIAAKNRNGAIFLNQISDSQSSVLHMSLCGTYLFALCKDKMIHVLDVHPHHVPFGTEAGGRQGLINVGSSSPSAIPYQTVMGDRIVTNIKTSNGAACIASASIMGKRNDGWVNLLVCGITTLLLRIHVPTFPSNTALHAGTAAVMDTATGMLGSGIISSFAGTTASPTHAWLGHITDKNSAVTNNCNNGSIDADCNIAVTCSAGDAIIRVWDLSVDKSSSFISSKHTVIGNSQCRYILPCNYRVASLSVALSAQGGMRIAASTFAGETLLWSYTGGFMNFKKSALADPFPESAAVAFESTVTDITKGVVRLSRNRKNRAPVVIPTARVLSACVIPFDKNNEDVLNNGDMVVVRGRYAFPMFTTINLNRVLSLNLSLIIPSRDIGRRGGRNEFSGRRIATAPLHHVYLTLANKKLEDDFSTMLGNHLSVTKLEHLSPSLAFMEQAKASIQEINHNVHDDSENENASANDLYHYLTSHNIDAMNVASGVTWAAHIADSHRAAITSAEEYSTPVVFKAVSTKALPIKAIQDAGSDMSKNASSSSDIAEREFSEKTLESKALMVDISIGTQRGDGSKDALGLIVVPLYQALHAGDKSLVLELVTLSSRSSSSVNSTVKCLELNYVLQLLQILIDVVKSSSSGVYHPFHRWIAAIISSRALEMIQKEESKRLLENYSKELLQKKKHVTAPQGSAPSVFLRPLHYRYMQMSDAYDKLLLLKGRLGTFRRMKGVKGYDSYKVAHDKKKEMEKQKKQNGLKHNQKEKKRSNAQKEARWDRRTNENNLFFIPKHKKRDEEESASSNEDSNDEDAKPHRFNYYQEVAVADAKNRHPSSLDLAARRAVLEKSTGNSFPEPVSYDGTSYPVLTAQAMLRINKSLYERQRELRRRRRQRRLESTEGRVMTHEERLAISRGSGVEDDEEALMVREGSEGENEDDLDEEIMANMRLDSSDEGELGEDLQSEDTKKGRRKRIKGKKTILVEVDDGNQNEEGESEDFNELDKHSSVGEAEDMLDSEEEAEELALEDDDEGEVEKKGRKSKKNVQKEFFGSASEDEEEEEESDIENIRYFDDDNEGLEEDEKSEDEHGLEEEEGDEGNGRNTHRRVRVD